jgi:hypothetical protein
VAGQTGTSRSPRHEKTTSPTAPHGSGRQKCRRRTDQARSRAVLGIAMSVEMSCSASQANGSYRLRSFDRPARAGEVQWLAPSTKVDSTPAG